MPNSDLAALGARWLLDRLSPAGAKARLTVLIYHRVPARPDLLLSGEPDAARFETEMSWLQAWCNVLPLPEAIERLSAGTLPARAAAITFDDGYADNVTVALPILRRLGLPAAFFIATGYLDGGRMWNDTVIEVMRRAGGAELDLDRMGLGRYPLGTMGERQRGMYELLGRLKYREPGERSALAEEIARGAGVQPARDLMMTAEQVRVLAAAGMTIGAHTVNHPILARIANDEAHTEMAQSKQRLEAIAGVPVTLFAYPNGQPDRDYTRLHVQLARDAGFRAACSTSWGTATAGCDVFQIPRFTPWGRSPWRYALRLARNVRHRATLAH